MEIKQRQFTLNHEQAINGMLVGGHLNTVLIEGDTGCGKSALMKALQKALPNHWCSYCDCTTKDVGDFIIPKFRDLDDGDFFTNATNEELGLHLDQPVVLMFDEYEKANNSVKNAVLRLMLERKIGNQSLHPDSIVFATSNLGDEGLGDALLPHQEDRMTRIRLRKPTNIEWVDWAQANNIHYTVTSWALENSALFQSFTEVHNIEDNPYIYHPQKQQSGFVTPRGLERASHWMHRSDQMDNATLEAMLVGTIGPVGGMELFNYSKLISELPTMESIRTSPTTALVPTGTSAILMVINRTLQNIERDWVDAWMDYLPRLPRSAWANFLNGIKAKDHPKQAVVMNNQKFQRFANENIHMFTADKRS